MRHENLNWIEDRLNGSPKHVHPQGNYAVYDGNVLVDEKVVAEIKQLIKEIKVLYPEYKSDKFDIIDAEWVQIQR